MKEIKYGKTTVLATAVLLRTVRENLTRLEQMNWENGKSEEENLLTSHDDFFKLTELSNNLLELIDIDSDHVDELVNQPASAISVNIYDHSGDDTNLSTNLFDKGSYADIELSTEWLRWYKDTKNEEE
tara:strand:+ start:509 stop:892 length:384 start_codon:yes stop_codon:yes gene_type:complete